MRDKKLIKRIFTLLGPYKGRVALALVSMVLVSALAAAQAYLIKPLIDKIFINKDAFMLNILPLALIGVFLLKGFFYYLYSSILDIVGQSIIRDLRKDIFVHIHDLPISFFDKNQTGELISRVINDVTLIQMTVSNALIGLVKELFQIIGLLGVIIYLDWQMALIALVFLPLAILPVVYFGRMFRQLSTNNQQTVAEVSNVLYETITGHRVVKAFSMEKYECKRFAETIDRLFAIIVKNIKVNSLQRPIIELLGGLGIAAVIWYGGHLVISEKSTPGTFISFLTALIMIYEPIKGVSKLNSYLQQGMAAAIRVFGLLDTEVDIKDAPKALTLKRFQKSVRFDRVSFRYENCGHDVLKEIDLQVPAGEILAIVGPSGGGKSTLINLMLRFFDVRQGRILLDNHDIRDLTLRSLRQQMAIVSQKTVLFNDTVRNNIAYGQHDLPFEKIRSAAQAAHALEFIEELPQGFDTIIGESGSRLSGGQQQRIAIARALLKDAPILILDEATSALDTESEREVQMALENLMKNRTTFVIAHRLSTIRNADRIIVLDQGRIVEQGDHPSLLAQNGIYTNLYEMQFKE